MSHDPIENLFKKALAVKLDEKQKDMMRQEILLFVKNHPLKENPRDWLIYILNIIKIRLKTPAIMLAVISLLLLVGGAASVKADAALPGDWLYPVKTGFNEKIKQVLAFSDEAKLQVNTQLANLRLQEFETLAVEGKINKSNEAKINDDFKNHLDKVTKYANKLRAAKDNNLDSIGADFEALLRAQSIIINGLRKNAADNSADGILHDIDDATLNIFKVNEKINDNIPKPADQDNNIRQKVTAVENSIDRVQKLIQDKKVNIGSEAILQSKDNLNLVQQKIDEGKTKLSKNKDDYQGLISSLREASVIAKESQYLIDAKNKLRTNIPINIRFDHK